MKIDHDYHIHTNLSLCAAKTVTAEHYINKAVELGLTKIGFTNHLWDENIKPVLNDFYVPQTVTYNLTLKEELERIDHKGLDIYFGAEAEFHPELGIALTEENAEKFDYIIVSNSHTHMTMPRDFLESYKKHADFMVEAYSKILSSSIIHRVLSIAYPFEAIACPYDRNLLFRYISDDTLKELIFDTANKGIALEINTSCYPKIDKDNFEDFGAVRMFRIAHDMGCKFTFGSDAHSETEHDNYIRIANTFTECLNLTEKDIAVINRK